MAETPWDKLQPDTGIRVDGRGRHDIFWVRMPDRTPGLIMKLSGGAEEVHPLPKLKNLSLSYRHVDGSNTLCLSLTDKGQVDIFEALCRDVIDATEAADTVQSALSKAVQRTCRWHHLLRGGSPEGLTIEEQRGLVAELAVLRELAVELGPRAAIEAWKGPEGSPKDFETFVAHVEVKARRGAANAKIAISSEAQLEAVPGFDLYLKVLDVDTAIAPAGPTLADHVVETGLKFHSDPTAMSLWEQRLIAAGYRDEEVDSSRSWKIGTSRTYRVADGFPRITSPLPPGVSNVGYSIDLHVCAPYQVADDIFLCS